MAIPKRALLLSSAAITFFTSRYAPQFALFPRSYLLNSVTLFFLQIFVRLFWTIIVYPLFFSPLRHLPQPPVRCTSESCSRFVDIGYSDNNYNCRTRISFSASSEGYSGIRQVSRKEIGLIQFQTMVSFIIDGCSMNHACS